MPSAYTFGVNDGTVTTLRDYALICARAFGAYIDLKEEPLAPAPAKLPPRVSYHKQALADAEQRLAELVHMTDAEKAAAAAAYNVELTKSRYEAAARNDRIRNNYNAMLAKVVQWEGPEELRKFMMDQLVDSRNFDVSSDPTNYMPETKGTDAWYLDEVDKAERDIAYHTKHLIEDEQREAERQAWIDRLFASLPPAEENV